MALTPEQLKEIPNEIVELYQSLENFIIKDFARKILKTGEVTSSAEWQALRATEIGLASSHIKKELKKLIKLSENEIERLFNQSALESIDSDNKIFENGGLDIIKINDHPYLKQLLEASMKQTNKELKNLTNSLGFAEIIGGKVVYSTITKFYQKQLDLATMKILTGVTDYNSAIKHAIKILTNSGVRYVDFPTGWSNRIDVAVRRVVMTGVNQMAAKMVDYNCDALGVELVEVLAHGGARLSHQDWQGQIYTRGTATDKYENFEDATQYGEADGLCGINCRHSYAPFVEGSPRTWSDKQLEDLKNSTVDYNGKTDTEYEASQYQRKLERGIRQSKREILAYHESGLKKDFENASIKLQRQREKYNDFAKTTGIKKQDYRHQVEGFGRSIAQKSSRVKER